jgi:hypothetical protein
VTPAGQPPLPPPLPLSPPGHSQQPAQAVIGIATR